MNAFNSSWFKFDGVDSKQYGYKMIELGSSSNEAPLGLEREVQKEDGIGDIGVFKGVKNSYRSITIQLTKTNKSGNKILPFLSEDYEFLNRWLFKNNYKAFETENGLVYFVIFKKAQGKLIGDKTIITLEMECEPTAYTPIMTDYAVVSGLKIFEAKNLTTIRENTPIDFHVSMIEGDTLHVTNLNTGKKFTIAGLQNNEEFDVCSKLHSVKSKIEGKRNLYKLCNRVFDLDLLYGKNRIKVECFKSDGSAGKCEIQILFQSKMAFQL